MVAIHAFDWLEQDLATSPGVVAVVGDDRFLKRITLTKLRHALSEDGVATQLDGAKAAWRDVRDELGTLSLFGGGPRLVIVDSGDDFVSQCRTELEQLVTEPPSSGCLILDLKTLPSNTRLYKQLEGHGQIIECRAPQVKRGRGTNLDEAKLCQWLKAWGRTTHHIALKSGADEELVQLVGSELGLLDQELAKLALFAEAEGEVTVELVRKIVGGWRAKTSWELLDAALDGQAAEALLQLERLLQAGEAPQMIAGAVLWSVRRFADAAQLVMEAEQAGRRTSLTAALEEAGIKKWPKGALARAERQLRQLGRHRAAQLYQQLLQLDLSLKGSHAAPHRSRWALEKFILSMAKATS